MPKAKKPTNEETTEPQNELQQKVDELTFDLQRTRADFENYRKRVESEKDAAKQTGKTSAILRILPVIDNIERAVAHTPAHLADDKWAQGVASLSKNLEKSLDSLGLRRIEAGIDAEFDPSLHEAIQFDEEAEGDKEVIAEELQAGYMLGNDVIRHSMVKVTKQ